MPMDNAANKALYADANTSELETQPDITFGVELEFMSPCPESGAIKARRSRGAAARLHIAQLLAAKTDLPIACLCTHPKDAFCAICYGASDSDMHDAVRVLSPGRLRHEAGTELRSNYFLFQPEYLDTRGRISALQHWAGIEISSPIFPYSELAAGLPALTTAVATLRGIDCSAKVAADDSCGLHVHVGVAGGMTLLLAKKVTSLVLVLEDGVFARLCGPSRLLSDHCGAVGHHSRLAGGEAPTSYDVKPLAGGSGAAPERMRDYIPAAGACSSHISACLLHRALSNLWQCRSLCQLAVLLCQRVSTKIGLVLALRDTCGTRRYVGEPLPPGFSFEGTPSTAEFRYAQMSFDGGFLRAWVELVCRVVAVAQREPAAFKHAYAAICEALDGDAEEEEPGWERVLRTVLGLGHQVPFWRAQRDMYRRGVEIAHLDDMFVLMPERDEMVSQGL